MTTIAGKVRLREKRMSDGKNDYAWRNDPELARLDAASALDISLPEYLAEYAFELAYPSARRREFAIETIDDKHIGNCVYYNIDAVHAEAELGIMIGDRSCWSKGYGAEAISSLLTYIFRRTSLERVYLNTLDWNVRAQKCFKKCGFAQCGYLERDGRNFLVMELFRKDWERRHADS